MIENEHFLQPKADAIGFAVSFSYGIISCSSRGRRFFVRQASPRNAKASIADTLRSLICDFDWSLVKILESLAIRRFTEEDVEFAYEMTTAEEWNVTKGDIERMLSYEPDGSFIADANGLRVGHVFAITYEKLGWIGLLIVRKEYRNKRAGTLLMKRAIDYLLNRGVQTIDLDAVPEISGLYQKLGFTDRFDSLRFMGTRRRIISGRTDSATQMDEKDIAEAAEFDARYFGADRTRVLASLYQAYTTLCFVSHARSDFAGYIMCRKAENGYNIGPFVCNSEHVAAQLLAKCLSRLPLKASVYVGVPSANGKAAEILRRHGFKQYSKSIRMRFGRNLETERQSDIYAIGGPMKG
jgi:ribosomal protein S18 acetylase RimI-like enzyme